MPELLPSARPEEGAARRLLARVGPAFDRRLDARSSAPLAVGFSGGGDSLALLIAALAWSDRPVLALCVDHGLQSASAAWTEAAGRAALALGAEFRALAWAGPKPSAGLPAAARRARHALLAEAARAAGARVLLLGHTGDDLMEAALMRQAGSSVGDPREWSPSPVWPEGRDLFLFRPLLALRRARIRAILADAGLGWLDDPANDDPRFLRARARESISNHEPQTRSPPQPDQQPVRAFRVVRGSPFEAAGVIGLERAALDGPDARRLLGAAVVCAGGGGTPPRGDRLDRLLERLRSQGHFIASLGGARIEAGQAVVIMRDAGELQRRGMGRVPLQDGVPTVWDGRFELTATRPGICVRPARGVLSRLPAEEKAALKALPPAARGALPVLQDEETLTCPILAQGTLARARTLIAGRLAGACGGIARESELCCGPDSGWTSGALS